ncbi:hypothetical protein OAD67_00495 [bacterium]|nr:hypothetical protein [bacterium]
MSRKKSDAERRKRRVAAKNAAPQSDPPEAFHSLPLDVVVTYVLSSDSLPDPIDLERVSELRTYVTTTSRGRLWKASGES